MSIVKSARGVGWKSGSRRAVEDEPLAVHYYHPPPILAALANFITRKYFPTKHKKSSYTLRASLERQNATIVAARRFLC